MIKKGGVSRVEYGEVVAAEQSASLMHFNSDKNVWNEQGSGIIRVRKAHLVENQNIISKYNCIVYTES